MSGSDAEAGGERAEVLLGLGEALCCGRSDCWIVLCDLYGWHPDEPAAEQSEGSEDSSDVKSDRILFGKISHGHGDYPHPKYRNETEKIDGIVTKTGPAKALYQAISGDGNDAIMGGQEASDGTTEDGATSYWEDIANPLKDGQIRKSVPVAKTASSLMLIDPWGHPLQYEMYDSEFSDEDVQNIHNMTFDLWSFGEDESLGNDPEKEAEWITNY